MRMKLYLVLLLCICSTTCFAQIKITIIAPAKELVPDQVILKATVTSVNELTSVTANIGGLQTPLVYNTSSKYFEGSLSLLTLHEGDSLNLQVTAIDAYNNQQTAVKKIKYDNPPQISVIEPRDNFTATPLLHFKIANIDFDSCTLSVYASRLSDDRAHPDTTLLYRAKIKDSAEGDVDLSAYANKHFIWITVTDRSAQKDYKSYYINIVTAENSPGLHLIYKAPYDILDFKNSKIFAVGDSALHPRIIDINNNTQVPVPVTGPITGPAFLTGYGAIFPINKTYYDWNSGVFDSLADTKAPMAVSGNFATWNRNSKQYFRDISTKTTVVIDSDADFDNSVAQNGLVAYGNKSHNIVTWQNGTTTILTTDESDKSNDKPVTDGSYVAYIKSDYPPPIGSRNMSLYLNDGQNNIQLNSVDVSVFFDLPYYKISNKYTAFAKLDISGFTQVCLRDTTGTITQLTHFGTSSQVIDVNEKGEVMLMNGSASDLYLVPFNGALRKIESGNRSQHDGSYPRTYYQDSNWYVVMGNSVFKVTPDSALPLNLLYFNAGRQGNINKLTWQTSNEINTAGFEVERGVNAHDFALVGTMAAAGNSSIAETYNFTDAQPLAGTNYYRLKMIDKDGAYTYSEIKSVINNNAAFSARLYPNPVHNTALLQFKSNKPRQVKIDIIDINGKVVLTAQYVIDEGNVTRNMDIKRLPAGTYLISIKSDGREQVGVKLVKE